MKKFYFLLIFVSVLTSCSSDSSDNPIGPNANLLQRVDFYPGLASERRWIFNSDGLLEKITKANGTVTQNFSYDDDNRLISSTIFFDGGTTETHTFSYNNNGFVTAVDGTAVLFDASSGSYYTGELNQTYEMTKINNDKLLVSSKTAFMDEIEEGVFEEVVWQEMMVGYTNSNISSYSNGDTCHSLTYDNKTNPLKNATLAIGRAFSFISNSRWSTDYCISANNVLTHNYCSEDPESEVYHYSYNANNLPSEQTHDSYYFGTLEGTTISAKFYYQGDVLP